MPLIRYRSSVQGKKTSKLAELFWFKADGGSLDRDSPTGPPASGAARCWSGVQRTHKRGTVGSTQQSETSALGTSCRCQRTHCQGRQSLLEIGSGGHTCPASPGVQATPAPAFGISSLVPKGRPLSKLRVTAPQSLACGKPLTTFLLALWDTDSPGIFVTPLEAAINVLLSFFPWK